MKTLQEKYNAVLEGNFPKSQFVRDAKMEVPRFISPYNGFEDTVQILKNKGMLVEAKAETPEYDKPAPGYPLEALERGVDYELEKAGVDTATETATEDQYEKAKKKAEKNLEKDVNHYLHLLSGDSKKVDKHDREVEVDQKKLFKGTVDPKGGKAEGNTDTFNAMKKATLREAAMAKGYTEEQVEAAIKRLQEKKENKVDEDAKETSFSSDEIKSVSFPNGLSVTVGEEHPEEEGIVIGIEKGENGYLIMFQDGSEGGGYHVDFDGEFLDEDDFIEENKAKLGEISTQYTNQLNAKIQNDPEFSKKIEAATKKAMKGDSTDLANLMNPSLQEGDPIVDEHEFDFFKEILDGRYKDEEIEEYLKSDDYQQALETLNLDASDTEEWIGEFTNFFGDGADAYIDEEKIDEGDPIVDEHEFNFFKTFFGIGSKDVYPNTNAEDEEIEAYLKSDNYQEELKHSELDEKDIAAWIDSFLDWRASTGREKVFKQDIKEAVKKVIKHVLKENHQSLDSEVASHIESFLNKGLKAKFLEAGKDLIEDLLKDGQYFRNDVVSHLANELNLHVPIRDLFKEGALNEGRGDLDMIVRIIDDRADESGFEPREEAAEVIAAIADHYKLNLKMIQNYLDSDDPVNPTVGEAKTIDVYGDGDVVVNIDKATPEQERLLDFEFEISEFGDSEEAQAVADQIMNLNSEYDVEDYYANERGWDEDSDLRSMVRTAIDVFRGLNENQDAIKFAQFIHAHGLKDKQIKDEEYLKDLYDNYKESVKESINEADNKIDPKAMGNKLSDFLKANGFNNIKMIKGEEPLVKGGYDAIGKREDLAVLSLIQPDTILVVVPSKKSDLLTKELPAKLNLLTSKEAYKQDENGNYPAEQGEYIIQTFGSGPSVFTAELMKFDKSTIIKKQQKE